MNLFAIPHVRVTTDSVEKIEAQVSVCIACGVACDCGAPLTLIVKTARAVEVSNARRDGQ